MLHLRAAFPIASDSVFERSVPSDLIRGVDSGSREDSARIVDVVVSLLLVAVALTLGWDNWRTGAAWKPSVYSCTASPSC